MKLPQQLVRKMVNEMSDEPKVCECCSNDTGPFRLFMTMWMCPDCIAKNKELTAKSESEATARVLVTREHASDVIAVSNVLKQASDIDAAIQVKSDIFNAETVSIVELQKSIDTDDSISDKIGKLLELVAERRQSYQEKIFANQQENVDLANKQNAIQRYLNELKNKLTVEEREKYKLLDINYKPNVVKIANKPIKSIAKPAKLNLEEVRKAAARAGVPMQVIQMTCIRRNMTPMQASDTFLAAGSNPNKPD